MKRIIFILLTVLTMVSCGSSSLVNRSKRLELGMTKKKVVSVMGKEFKVTSAKAMCKKW